MGDHEQTIGDSIRWIGRAVLIYSVVAWLAAFYAPLGRDSFNLVGWMWVGLTFTALTVAVAYWRQSILAACAILPLGILCCFILSHFIFEFFVYHWPLNRRWP